MSKTQSGTIGESSWRTLTVSQMSGPDMPVVTACDFEVN